MTTSWGADPDACDWFRASAEDGKPSWITRFLYGLAVALVVLAGSPGPGPVTVHHTIRRRAPQVTIVRDSRGLTLPTGGSAEA